MKKITSVIFCVAVAAMPMIMTLVGYFLYLVGADAVSIVIAGTFVTTLYSMHRYYDSDYQERRFCTAIEIINMHAKEIKRLNEKIKTMEDTHE